MSVCVERALIGRHFAGTITPPEERAMREHLVACESCRRAYGRNMVLSELDPEALKAEERIGRGLGLARSNSKIAPKKFAPRLATIGTSVGAVLALAAAVLLFVKAPHESAQTSAQDDGFTARGANPHPSPVDSKVTVYDVHAAPKALNAGDSFRRGDELALAYQNGLAKTRLMVFAVDEHHHVYWFYPAWTSEADDPVAVPIATDAARHELPDAVHHSFDGRALEVHALFLDTAVSVKQIEALVAKQPNGPLTLPSSVDRTTSLSISP